MIEMVEVGRKLVCLEGDLVSAPWVDTRPNPRNGDRLAAGDDGIKESCRVHMDLCCVSVCCHTETIAVKSRLEIQK